MGFFGDLAKDMARNLWDQATYQVEYQKQGMDLVELIEEYSRVKREYQGRERSCRLGALRMIMEKCGYGDMYRDID